ncbi:putative nuclear envelope protein [Rhizodiscina lignyota]|uniref:Nuclear envelope protein n=1 Tax=Rhizodiscina lignyota TaxID=1504668 RepID=A0A9P4IK31_9PEZI|nr:putative nuclear envelope protein [Rhizodiscina lignyota]
MSTPQKPKARPYRDFLTPSLHRRFTGAALWSLLSCYLIAMCWSSFHIIWTWFPIGPAGVRTLLLFICPLLVYILRVGNIHVGSLTTSSPFETFYLLSVRPIALQVFTWYTLSALCFCEVSIWASSESDKLGMVDHGKSYERSRLNERPIYLRAMFFYAAVIQSLYHVYFDYDRVALPITSSGTQSGPFTQLQATFSTRKLMSMLARFVWWSVSGVLVYTLFLRWPVFNAQYFLVSKIYRLPKATASAIPPDFFKLSIRYLVDSFLLLCIWELANALSTIYLSKEPLKRGQPLTNDSKDPNGSLISGLKGRKEFSKNMAFWELLLITRDFDARRKTIFEELDRQGSTTWSQISNICMAEIKTVTDRIEEFNRPAVPPQEQPEIQSLPRLSQPLKDENVFAKPNGTRTSLDGAIDALGNFAKSHGNSPGADPISPRVRKLIGAAAHKDQQQTPQGNKNNSTAAGLLGDLLHSPSGAPFRQSFARRATAVVCGSPVSRSSTITAAINVLTQLVTISLKEDKYGCVQKDVLSMFRCFTTTTQSIEKFLQTLPPHWTDVEFKEQSRVEVEGVNEVLESLRKGMEGLLMVYGEYLEGLGATGKEVKEAKDLVSKRKPLEMAEQN